MLRYLSPALFALATAYMWHHNNTSTGSRLLLPFVDVLLPSRAGDPVALGEASVVGAAGLTVLVLGVTVIDHVRAIRRRRQLQRE